MDLKETNDSAIEKSSYIKTELNIKYKIYKNTNSESEKSYTKE